MKKTLIIYLLSTIFFLLVCYTPSEPESTPTMISVYRTETCTISMIPLESYVAGVVASEMSPSFHMEALKAQAVAARTYAVAKSKATSYPDEHPMAPVCDSTHCQVYSSDITISQKIKNAVKETASELLYYDGELVTNALYHASSGGRTENSEDVFVSAVPYLKSVSSPYEKDYERNGHGVGMSQQGANGMAKEGFEYKKILSHYYSGTVVY